MSSGREVSVVRIDVSYSGDLRCKAAHGPSGAEIVTDAPVDNCGKGEAFSPTDLVATALGACLATMMGIVAQREGLSLEGLRVEVEKEMTADPHRRIGRIGARVQMPAGLSEAQKRKLEAAAAGCPVFRSLSPSVSVELSFSYP